MIGVADVREAGAAIAALTRALEPDAVAMPDALPMWEAFDAIERRAAAAKLLLTARVDESRAAQRSGQGCPRTRVETDHRIPFRETRHTRLDECDPICTVHHRQKHRDGWALVHGTGKRVFVPPDDPRHPEKRRRRE